MSQAEVPRAESIDDQERVHAADGDKKPKSRRPASTRSPFTPEPGIHRLAFSRLTRRVLRYRFSTTAIKSLAVSLFFDSGSSAFQLGLTVAFRLDRS
jgi:hypothetical protein